MNKLRIGDNVKILSGKDSGKTGEILKISDERVTVKGINMVTKHMKKTQNSEGGLVKMEKPIHISNVQFICPHTSKPTRVGISIVDNKGKKGKVRMSKKAEKQISDTFTKSN